MKRFLLLLGLVGLLAGNVSAQQTFILSTLTHKGFVSVTAGYSVPVASPFGKNTQKLMGGGQSAQVSLGYRLGRRLGMVGSYSFVSNTIRQDALLKSVSGNLESSYWKSNATNCTLQTLMVGPLLTVPMGRFIFDFQLTGGYAQATSSRMELSTEFLRMPLTYTTPSQTTNALAAGAGFTTRYKVNRWLALHASAQYITADLKYDNLMQEIQIGRQVSQEPVQSHQPTGILNLGAGFSFLF
jgi:opacity protein-like surface antigen